MPTLTRRVLDHHSLSTGDAMDAAVRFDLSTTGTTWSHVDRFTRFVSWSVLSTLDTAAEVTLDVVAKG